MWGGGGVGGVKRGKQIEKNEFLFLSAKKMTKTRKYHPQMSKNPSAPGFEQF